ncbi:MAG: hypothetical protein AB7U73_25395 [Pirellulales bacterium]
MQPIEYRQRVEMVRRQWTAPERRQRAELGRNRAAQFVSTIVARDEPDDALWAVGSLTLDDIERLREAGT